METKETVISKNDGVTVTKVQQVRKPSDCDKNDTFHAIPCSREDRDCEACIQEAKKRGDDHWERIKKARAETERKRKIPIDLKTIGNLKGSELFKELDDRVMKRWNEIKAIESEDGSTRSEAVSKYEKRHGIIRDKELSLVPASFGHYGGSYVKMTPEQEKVLRKVFGRLFPRTKTSSGDSIYFANGTKGSKLLSALDRVIIKLEYPEYWD